ncbi:hypothetical protein L0Z36_26090 [Burkholderia multivorans]|uniref:hypothetical protein n=1 Tax=Burkholderia multivorans TaxID=87883 RepID=UPI002018F358|nr:hypothetical protein [Burkholderia multivorans]UQP02890.1 hypothetical protein L0Z36_26090 [Burkholderia multivorans]
MGQQQDLYDRWKRAKNQLNNLFKKPENTLIVHYSCESFYDQTKADSPRVTSIAVRNLQSGQTHSFSIHFAAERAHALDQIENRYDEFEKAMLNDFFAFARDHQFHTWLHWNMRDMNYGFPALEHRAAVLGAQSFHIDEKQLVDLSRVLIAIYGNKYTGHPRIQSLMEKNHITPRDFMVGQSEAHAFEQKRFLDMHRSTLSKVDVFANFAERAHSGTLKTNANWFDRNGRSFKAGIEKIREHWFWGALIAVAFGAWNYRDQIVQIWGWATKHLGHG